MEEKYTSVEAHKVCYLWQGGIDSWCCFHKEYKLESKPNSK
jgi:hypothetical protein